MRYLLDAHTLIWSQDDAGKLSPAATTALSDPAHEIAELRDYLLPKLLSGAVRVREAERAVEETC